MSAFPTIYINCNTAHEYSGSASYFGLPQPNAGVADDTLDRINKDSPRQQQRGGKPPRGKYHPHITRM